MKESKPILLKKEKKEMSISTNLYSTTLIDDLKKIALKIADFKGHGITIEINCINNKERQNCSMKITEKFD